LFDEAFCFKQHYEKNFLFTVFYFLAFAILLFTNKVSGIVVDKQTSLFLLQT
jgi:hypothetical protein